MKKLVGRPKKTPLPRFCWQLVRRRRLAPSKRRFKLVYPSRILLPSRSRASGLPEPCSRAGIGVYFNPASREGPGLDFWPGWGGSPADAVVAFQTRIREPQPSTRRSARRPASYTTSASSAASTRSTPSRTTRSWSLAARRSPAAPSTPRRPPGRAEHPHLRDFVPVTRLAKEPGHTRYTPHPIAATAPAPAHPAG